METTTPRKLNMEEKRKLEKMLLADIESAETEYSSKRSRERAEMERNAEENPPQEAKKLFGEWTKNQEKKEELEHSLSVLGYRVCYGDELSVNHSSDEQPKAIRDFDAETRSGKEKLAELCRAYTLKLFAGGEEAQELFKALSADIAKLTA